MKKSRYRQLYFRMKEHHQRTIEDLEETLEGQALIIDQVKSTLNNERKVRREIGNRLDKIENDGRTLTMENLMARWHEIKLNTEVLWITSPNVSIVNHGTMANIQDRLRRLCPQLKLVLFTVGDIEVETMTEEELLKLGLKRVN